MTSKSTKSASVSARRPANKWRLKKTLSRKTDFRPIEDEDIKYIWAAYKTGALASMGEKFEDGEMSPIDFAMEFVAEVKTNYHGAWVLMAEGRQGYGPVGLVLGFYSHPDPVKAPFMYVGDMVWMPWASARNKIEASVNFFNKVRKEVKMVECAAPEDKEFFEMMMQHGIMRRVGKSYNIYPDKVATIFETK